MKTPQPIEIGSALGVLSAAAAAVIAQLPGLSFFTNNSPPSFFILGLLTSGLTIAVFLWVLINKGRDRRKRVKQGLVSVCASIVLAMVYIAFLSWVTVLPPEEYGSSQRFQIGFGLQEFSLTEEAKAVVATEESVKSTQDLMLAFGAFSSEGPRQIWTVWSIYSAWALLCLTFIATYFMWAFGLAKLASVMIVDSREVADATTSV